MPHPSSEKQAVHHANRLGHDSCVMTCAVFSIHPYLEPALSPSQRKRAEALATSLRNAQPSLRVPPKLRPLIAEEIVQAPSLHLDDQSAIASNNASEHSEFVQDRARARAVEGDYLVTSAPPPVGYEAYCEKKLELGHVSWLSVTSPGDPRRVASHAMQDRSVRRALMRAVRRERLLYLHPYMGHDDVWELALLIREATRRPVKVLAPFPGLTAWVNDKVTFAETVVLLFGTHLVPPTYEASNLALLAERVRDLAQKGCCAVVKVPDSASGAGNIVLQTEGFATKSLTEIREDLQTILSDLPWHGEKHLLVGCWDDDAFAAPSVQLWIPPLDHADPIVEGVFEQALQGSTHRFIGSRRAQLPRALLEELAVRAALLGLLLQHLGYIGRCSFDLIVVGKDSQSARIEFIEANGRWGGTSTPMTLAGRLWEHWWDKPYVARGLRVPGLDRVPFEHVLRGFDSELFDVRTGDGRIVIYNPSSIAARSALQVIGYGETIDAAAKFLEEEVLEDCRRLARDLY